MRTPLISLCRMLAGIAVAVPAALLSGAPPAAAHPMPHSVVLLDVHETAVAAHLELPVDELRRASGIDLRTIAATDIPADALRTYLTAHIRPTTTNGQPWTVTIGDLSLSQNQQTATGPYQELLAQAVLTPPAGADVRNFTFGYDVIIHQVVTHIALVSVRQDWAAGRIGEGGDSAEQVGTIRIDTRTMTVPPLRVDLGTGSAWRGFLAMVRLGGTHILTGTDHLLFLLILLLPAPLLAIRGRWREPAGARTALTRIGRTTLAFTAGHSIALALSSFGRLDIPSWPVEAFIAASILVGAVHAIRPLFPGREAAVAGLFGLGHGLAFSFVLAEMQLSTGRLALSLLGFNLGIELVQILLVALALPPLLVIARLRAGPRLRVAGALLTGTAATGWLADRLGLPNPIARIADSAGEHTTPMVAGLAVTATLAIAWTLVNRRTRPTLEILSKEGCQRPATSKSITITVPGH
ncbi:HupE/UreJ family protein [Actinoplanes subtropicus]|uniref:HupE/UreJ family protein n=1 Tax=Actinoplanes subtropicus TaxID=543632 RepID=UPI00068BD02B|nr:HupE/UreJ family protein [Actinoplanes subtropicus]